MTEEELLLIRMGARITCLETALAILLRGLANSDTSPQSLLRIVVDGLPQSVSEVRFPGGSPEYSDLISGELQDAAESLVSFLKPHLDESNTNR